MVEVEWSLPGLRRAVVAVPYDNWREGKHLTIGKHLAEMVAGFDLTNERIARKMPGQ